MAGEGKNDKYIICSKRNCKYINDEEHINTDFGYTRLEGINHVLNVEPNK